MPPRVKSRRASYEDVLAEPELHLEGGDAILVPDLAAWRLERLPSVPDEAFVSVVPDWVCEILSPSSVAFDRERKLPLYVRAGVAHAWLVDPIARTLEVLAARAGAFAAVEIDLSEVWAR